VHQPGNFVKYAGSVCDELEMAYIRWTSGSGPATLKVDLENRIASTGTEAKAFAHDSGYDFEADFTSMKQTNLRTGYKREMFRQTIEVAQEPPSLLTRLPTSIGHGRSSVMARSKQQPIVGKASRVSSLPAKPNDLAGEDALLLHAGQLVQTSKQRPDGWAYGSVIYDEIEDRPPVTADGLSSSAGWFPLDVTEPPSMAQLEKLQSKMGGAGAELLQPPQSWEPVRDPQTAELFSLKPGAELARVSEAFMRTLNASKVSIVKVERIENMSLWQSFAVKRQTVLQRESDQASAARLERTWLFHGTTADIVPKIIQQGFNRAFCGRNATRFGKGVYFAVNSSYSASTTYSAPDASGVQRMFLCKVVVGDYCHGKPDAIAPDVRTGHQLYDTTVDNTSNPSMFVTYHDAQAYPEYLVHFKQS